MSSGPIPGNYELVMAVGDDVVRHPLPDRGPVILGRDVAPGRDGEHVVRIADRGVSKRHATLHLDPPLRIQDLGSRNGTFVAERATSAEGGETLGQRRIAEEPIPVAVGERIGLGATVSVMVRRVPAAGSAARAVDAEPVVRDPAMVRLYQDARRAARSRMTVLLLGESGVGKEILARTIHESSPRAAGPFVELNCGALPAELADNELFGHEPGAFSDARKAHKGLIEAAHGGTLFLDEVGELPPAVQAKLLRVLEDGKIRRLGGSEVRTVDVRVIAATLRDLEAEAARGGFRADLLNRLRQLDLHVPPLRERPSEIAPLVERFLAAEQVQSNRAAPLTLSPRALAVIERYPWPGNVRELRNAIDRAAVLCEGTEIQPEDLPARVARPAARAPIATPPDATPLDERWRRTSIHDDDERSRLIREALDRTTQNVTRAAELLGISLRNLHTLIDRYQLQRSRKR